MIKWNGGRVWRVEREFKDLLKLRIQVRNKKRVVLVYFIYKLREKHFAKIIL